MATLIPAIGSVAFDSTGERCSAERLEQKLDAEYLLWHSVSIGFKQTQPDFVVLHPGRDLLVLYDDAQGIYERARSKQFSFKSMGIQAQGRTTILKSNYRNTRQILHTASLVAADLLTADDKDDDGIPLLKPVSCGREGQEPLIIKLPTLQAEAEAIADQLAQAHQEGFAWGDMAVLCADTKTRDLCARTLAQRKLPVENRLGSGDFDPTSNKIKVMTMKVSKGLEFPVVALPGVGHMPAPGEDEKEAARVFYVAATRATQRLVVTTCGGSVFGKRLQAYGTT